MNIFQLSLVDMFALLGLVVHELPEEHPDEAKSTDDDESPFPTESLGQRRDAKRSGKSAHRGSSIEDRGRESPVFLGEIFSGHLDGRREVSSLSKGEDATAQQE